MKNTLEWYLGIPPAGEGQGTDWTWLYQSPWPSWAPSWLIVLLVLAAVGLVGWVHGQDGRSSSIAKRILLTGLRLALAALMLLILSELTLVVDRTGLPFVAVMIDDSASMNLDDHYSEADEQEAARRLAGPDAERLTRIGVARGILTERDASFLRELQDRHQVRLYRFAENAVPLSLGESAPGASLQSTVSEITSLQAVGPVTRPGPALQKVLSDFRGSPPSAVIILSDGINTGPDEDRLTVAAGLAARKLVPLYTVAIGSEEAMHDLHLYDTLVDEVAFVDDPIVFTTRLKSFGFAGKQIRIDVKLKDKREVLSSTTATAPEDGQSIPVEVSWIPREAGEYDFVIEAATQPTETDTTNNSETRHVSVREGRIRVLLADSLPRWEYRELKSMLEREKTVELHTVLQDSDIEYADQDLTAQPLRGRFPVNREQLFSYDVIILGDLNPRFLAPTTLDHLRDFVRETGGGLIMIAGTEFNPRAYRDSVLETLLPIELDGLRVPSPDEPLTTEFRPQLTVEGRKSTPIFRFDESETDSSLVWKGLPGLYWMIEAPNVKPGATVFAEHPTQMGSDGRLPVIVMQRFGAGKVLFHATDETWLWRRRVGDLYFGRYWVQAIRYLSRSRLLGQSKNAELQTDRQVYQRGEPVGLRVRFYDDEQIPDDKDGVTVILERRGGEQREVVLTRIPQATGVFEGQMRRGLEGTWHAWVSRPEFAESPPATDFRIESPERELRLRGLDRRELVEAAKLTRGRFYTLADVDELPAQVPRGRPVPIRSEDPIHIWNRWEILTLFCLLITGEWLLRKRMRMR